MRLLQKNAAERVQLHKLLEKSVCVTAHDYLKQHDPATLNLLTEPREALLLDAERASVKAGEIGALCLHVVETDGPCKGYGTYAVPPGVWGMIYRD
jgi:hypothetical protein